MKTILLCGNGLSGEVIATIKSWNYKVALISEFPFDVGTSDADFYVEANSKDPKEALSGAKKIIGMGAKIDGILSLCWDTAISVATIANELNLRSISLESAIKATAKDKRSEAFRKANIPAPAYAIVKSYDQLLEAIDGFELPIVLKPVDQSSSKGVIKVSSINCLLSAYRHCRSFSTNENIIINECLTGSEHSAEGLMIDGDLHLTAISDRVFSYELHEPYFVEVGDVMPTTLSAEIGNEINKITKQAARALGITNGVVKADLMYNPDKGINVIEIAARLGGPRFGTEMVPLSNGTNILKAAVQQALGEEIDMSLLVPSFSKGMVNRSIFPEPGIIQSISNITSLNECEGFYSFKWWERELQVGDEVSFSQYGCGGVAYFIAYGATRDEALKHANKIERHIQIHTRPR